MRHTDRSEPLDNSAGRAERQVIEVNVTRGRWLRLAVVLVALAIAVAAVAQALNVLPRWVNPFAEDTRDRSGPVLLRSIRDLSRYEAASGNFQVIVDLEKDARFLPDSVRGERTLFVGTGSVDAYVDFSRLGSGAVSVTDDRTAVTVRLPHAELERTNLDARRSYVFAQQRGLVNRIGDFLGANPADEQQLYVLAAEKIQTAAAGSGLRARADRNTKVMMEGMLKALGFTSVTVRYVDQV